MKLDLHLKERDNKRPVVRLSGQRDAIVNNGIIPLNLNGTYEITLSLNAKCGVSSNNIIINYRT